MWIHSPANLGNLVREARRRRGLSQAALADRLETTRQWVIALERGNPSAALDRVLKTLHVLGLRVDVASEKEFAANEAVARAAAIANQVLTERTASGTLRRLSTAVEQSGPESR